MIHTPYNGTSPAAPDNIIEGLTQIMTQVTNNNKKEDASKQMMKNIKTVATKPNASLGSVK